MEVASPEQVAHHTSGFAHAALEQIGQGIRNNQEEAAPGLWQTVVVDSPETLQPLSRVTQMAFPVPEVILAHPLGEGHPVAAMDNLQQIAESFVGDAEKPISPQLYWWHPNSRGRAQGEPLDLRPVGITMDHESRSVSLHTADEEFAALLNSLSQQG